MAEVLDAERGTETRRFFESVARRRFEPSGQRILIPFCLNKKPTPVFLNRGLLYLRGRLFDSVLKCGRKVYRGLVINDSRMKCLIRDNADTDDKRIRFNAEESAKA